MGTLEDANNQELLSALREAAAEVLMEQYGGLTPLAQASFHELQQVKGVGKSKAAAIKSAFLLAQRLASESLPEAPLLDTPEAVANLLRERNRLYTVEHLQVVFLNTRKRLIGVATRQGTLDTLLVDAGRSSWPPSPGARRPSRWCITIRVAIQLLRRQILGDAD